MTAAGAYGTRPEPRITVHFSNDGGIRGGTASMKATVPQAPI